MPQSGKDEKAGSIAWSPDFKAAPRPGNLQQALVGLELLGWARVTLAGPVGVAVRHNFGTSSYLPIAAVLGPSAKIGAITFTIHGTHCTIHNEGPENAPVIVAFLALPAAKKL